jgi:hypothetical protein
VVVVFAALVVVGWVAAGVGVGAAGGGAGVVV